MKRRVHCLRNILPLALCTLLAVRAAADNSQSIAGCPETTGTIKSLPAGSKSWKFCVSEKAPTQIWLEPWNGQNFEPMAQFCCLEAPTILQRWRQEKPSPERGRWYLIPVNELKPEIRGSLISTSTDSGDNKVEQAAPNDNKPALTDTSQDADNVTSSEFFTSELEPDLTSQASSSFYKDLIYRLLPVLVLASIVIAVVIFIGKRRKSTVMLGDAPPRGNHPPKDEGALANPTAGYIEQFTPAFAAALTRALEQAFKSSEGRRITIELAPPTSMTMDWVSFLRAVKSELDRPAMPTGSDRDNRAPRPNWPDPDRGNFSGPSTGDRAGAGRQLYATRSTYYGDGSNNFGGRPVFTESSDSTAAFSIRVAGGEIGWLTPNSNAREFDPLYFQIFGLNKNDFLAGAQASPKQVRLESGQWVLVSPR